MLVVGFREVKSMAIELPKKEDLKRIAKENHFEISDSEADAIGAMLIPIVSFLDRIDQTPIEPSPSVKKYRERDAGRRPTREEDPLNAVVRKISVKGAASGKLKGKRIGVKDSVAVAGIPISGGSHVLEGFAPDDDATIVSRMLDELRIVGRRHHQRARPDAQPSSRGVLRGWIVVRFRRGALLRLDRYHHRHRPGRVD
jgi:hypothetical protein